MARPRRQLAARRKAAGSSQESLAYAVGVDRSTVARWESGETAPQPELRPRPARRLGVSLAGLAKLLSGDVSEPLASKLAVVTIGVPSAEASRQALHELMAHGPSAAGLDNWEQAVLALRASRQGPAAVADAGRPGR